MWGRTTWSWAPTGAITAAVGVEETRQGSRRFSPICDPGKMSPALSSRRCSRTTRADSTACQSEALTRDGRGRGRTCMTPDVSAFTPAMPDLALPYTHRVDCPSARGDAKEIGAYFCNRAL